MGVPSFLFLILLLFAVAVPVAVILFLPRRRLIGFAMLGFAMLGCGLLVMLTILTSRQSQPAATPALSLLDASTPGEFRVQPIDLPVELDLKNLQRRVVQQQRALEAIPASLKSEINSATSFSPIVTEADVSLAIERAKSEAKAWPNASTPVVSAPAESAASRASDAGSSTADVAEPATAPQQNDAVVSTPQDRSNYPAWVTSPPAEVDGKYAILLESHPFDNRFDCDRQMKKITQETIRAYGQMMAEDRGLQNVNVSGIRLTRKELKAASHERFYALRSTSMGDMTILYQLTVIDEAMNDKLVARMENSFVQKRVKVAGVMSTGVLTMLVGLFGVFRFAARNAPDPFE